MPNEVQSERKSCALEARTAVVQDRTFACLQETIDKLQVVNGKLDQTATELADKLDRNQQEIVEMRQALAQQTENVRAELSRKLDVLELLLNTPLGQRPDFTGRE